MELFTAVYNYTYRKAYEQLIFSYKYEVPACPKLEIQVDRSLRHWQNFGSTTSTSIHENAILLVDSSLIFFHAITFIFI